MKIYKILIVLLLVILTIGAVSATDENLTSDELTVSEDLQIESSVEANDEFLSENDVGNFTELSDLIGNTSEGNTLELDMDYMKKESVDINISKSITIDGKGHTLNANNISGIMNVNAPNVVLKNIVFKNVNGSRAIFINDNHCSIMNCSFIDCHKGGAILISRGDDTSLYDSRIINCSSEYRINTDHLYESIILTLFSQRININECSFANCLGSAIYIVGGNYTTVRNSRFINCTSGNYGGAICFYGGTPSNKILNSSFTNCSASSGGAIYFDLTEVVYYGDYQIPLYYYGSDDSYVADCNFMNCSAYEGGSIYWGGEQGEIRNSRIVSSQATKGAAISAKHPIIILNSTFENNTSYNGGDDVYGEIIPNFILEYPNSWYLNRTYPINIKFQNEYFEGNFSLYVSEDSENYALYGCTNINANTATINYNTTHEGTYWLKAVFETNYGSGTEIIKITVTQTLPFSELMKLIGSSNYLELNENFANDGSEEIISIGSRTIDGKGHTIDGNNTSGIFCILSDNVVLKNIIFKNGNGKYIAGAISSINVNNCSIINCTFINCAIYSPGNDWKIINSSFINCTAQYTSNEIGTGGAIDASGDGWTIIGSTFTQCSAYAGGAIKSGGNNWNIINSAFEKCDATGSGGAIYTAYRINYSPDTRSACDNWKIINSTFTQCSSNSEGGAIYSNGTDWDIINSTFTKCSAQKCGGAIYFNTKNFNIVNSNFTNNTAEKCPDWYPQNSDDINLKIVASNAKVTYTSNYYYEIKVYDENEKLVNDVDVVVKVNGKTFKTLKTTDGVAKFKVTQTPGTYKLTITALKSTVTKTLTVTHLVTLKTVTVKKSAKKLTLQATLTKVNGKYLKNKQITFKFNGKTYKAKTNSKGVAKATIKSTVLKKLKAGKTVTYQASYLKDTVKKTAKIKK